MERLNDLEDYLREATILDAYSFAEGGGHGGKQVLILEGGVGVLAKPGKGAEQLAMARREVAAWQIIRGLGWADLMGATVLRSLAELEDDLEGSVQVLWPNAAPDGPSETFDKTDTLRAATFDTIIQHTDRGGHNWLGVPKPEAGTPQLKLVDHGYAMDLPGQAATVQSTFHELHKDEELADEVVEAVEGLLSSWPPGAIHELLEDDPFNNVQERARRIVDERRLAPAQE